MSIEVSHSNSRSLIITVIVVVTALLLLYAAVTHVQLGTVNNNAKNTVFTPYHVLSTLVLNNATSVGLNNYAILPPGTSPSNYSIFTNTIVETSYPSLLSHTTPLLLMPPNLPLVYVYNAEYSGDYGYIPLSPSFLATHYTYSISGGSSCTVTNSTNGNSISITTSCSTTPSSVTITFTIPFTLFNLTMLPLTLDPYYDANLALWSHNPTITHTGTVSFNLIAIRSGETINLASQSIASNSSTLNLPINTYVLSSITSGSTSAILTNPTGLAFSDNNTVLQLVISYTPGSATSSISMELEYGETSSYEYGMSFIFPAPYQCAYAPSLSHFICITEPMPFQMTDNVMNLANPYLYLNVLAPSFFWTPYFSETYGTTILYNASLSGCYNWNDGVLAIYQVDGRTVTINDPYLSPSSLIYQLASTGDGFEQSASWCYSLVDEPYSYVNFTLLSYSSAKYVNLTVTGNYSFIQYSKLGSLPYAFIMNANNVCFTEPNGTNAVFYIFPNEITNNNYGVNSTYYSAMGNSLCINGSVIQSSYVTIYAIRYPQLNQTKLNILNANGYGIYQGAAFTDPTVSIYMVNFTSVSVAHVPQVNFTITLPPPSPVPFPTDTVRDVNVLKPLMLITNNNGSYTMINAPSLLMFNPVFIKSNIIGSVTFTSVYPPLNITLPAQALYTVSLSPISLSVINEYNPYFTFNITNVNLPGSLTGGSSPSVSNVATYNFSNVFILLNNGSFPASVLIDLCSKSCVVSTGLRYLFEPVYFTLSSQNASNVHIYTVTVGSQSVTVWLINGTLNVGSHDVKGYFILLPSASMFNPGGSTLIEVVKGTVNVTSTINIPFYVNGQLVVVNIPGYFASAVGGIPVVYPRYEFIYNNTYPVVNGINTLCNDTLFCMPFLNNTSPYLSMLSDYRLYIMSPGPIFTCTQSTCGYPVQLLYISYSTQSLVTGLPGVTYGVNQYPYSLVFSPYSPYNIAALAEYEHKIFDPFSYMLYSTVVPSTIAPGSYPQLYVVYGTHSYNAWGSYVTSRYYLNLLSSKGQSFNIIYSVYHGNPPLPDTVMINNNTLLFINVNNASVHAYTPSNASLLYAHNIIGIGLLIPSGINVISTGKYAAYVLNSFNNTGASISIWLPPFLNYGVTNKVITLPLPRGASNLNLPGFTLSLPGVFTSGLNVYTVNVTFSDYGLLTPHLAVIPIPVSTMNITAYGLPLAIPTSITRYYLPHSVVTINMSLYTGCSNYMNIIGLQNFTVLSTYPLSEANVMSYDNTGMDYIILTYSSAYTEYNNSCSNIYVQNYNTSFIYPNDILNPLTNQLAYQTLECYPSIVAGTYMCVTPFNLTLTLDGVNLPSVSPFLPMTPYYLAYVTDALFVHNGGIVNYSNALLLIGGLGYANYYSEITYWFYPAATPIMLNNQIVAPESYGVNIGNVTPSSIVPIDAYVRRLIVPYAPTITVNITVNGKYVTPYEAYVNYPNVASPVPKFFINATAGVLCVTPISPPNATLYGNVYVLDEYGNVLDVLPAVSNQSTCFIPPLSPGYYYVITDMSNMSIHTPPLAYTNLAYAGYDPPVQYPIAAMNEFIINNTLLPFNCSSTQYGITGLQLINQAGVYPIGNELFTWFTINSLCTFHIQNMILSGYVTFGTLRYPFNISVFIPSQVSASLPPLIIIPHSSLYVVNSTFHETLFNITTYVTQHCSLNYTTVVKSSNVVVTNNTVFIAINGSNVYITPNSACVQYSSSSHIVSNIAQSSIGLVLPFNPSAPLTITFNNIILPNGVVIPYYAQFNVTSPSTSVPSVNATGLSIQSPPPSTTTTHALVCPLDCLCASKISLLTYVMIIIGLVLGVALVTYVLRQYHIIDV